MAERKSFAAEVGQHWPDGGPPDWVVALAEACDRLGQRRAGEAIGYSGSLVSAVLRGRYTGDLAAVERKVRWVFLASTVACPILGEIQTEACLANQRKDYPTGNAQAVRLWRACRTCAHRTTEEKP